MSGMDKSISTVAVPLDDARRRMFSIKSQEVGILSWCVPKGPGRNMVANISIMLEKDPLCPRARLLISLPSTSTGDPNQVARSDGPLWSKMVST